MTLFKNIKRNSYILVLLAFCACSNDKPHAEDSNNTVSANDTALANKIEKLKKQEADYQKLQEVFRGIQNRRDSIEQEWRELDEVNGRPFIPENDLDGVCFLIDTIDYYKRPIIINSKNRKELVRINVIDTINHGFNTVYEGIRYKPGDTLNPFKPWLWIPSEDYFRLAFDCTDTIGKYYKIKLNEKDVAFISKENKDFKKQSYEDFVNDWTAIGFDFDRSENPLRELPDDNSKIIKHEAEDKYKIWQGEPIEIKGDWINTKTVKDETGWLRWRNGKKILIRIYYTC